MKIVMENVSKKDAKLLVKWLNGHTVYYHFIDKVLCRYHGEKWKYAYDVVRQ